MKINTFCIIIILVCTHSTAFSQDKKVPSILEVIEYTDSDMKIGFETLEKTKATLAKVSINYLYTNKQGLVENRSVDTSLYAEQFFKNMKGKSNRSSKFKAIVSLKNGVLVWVIYKNKPNSGVLSLFQKKNGTLSMVAMDVYKGVKNDFILKVVNHYMKEGYIF